MPTPAVHSVHSSNAHGVPARMTAVSLLSWTTISHRGQTAKLKTQPRLGHEPPTFARQAPLRHEPPTFVRQAPARQLPVLVGEIVVVADLLTCEEGPEGVDDDLWTASDIQHSSVRVWLARVVDVPRWSSPHRRVYDLPDAGFEGEIPREGGAPKGIGLALGSPESSRPQADRHRQTHSISV